MNSRFYRTFYHVICCFCVVIIAQNNISAQEEGKEGKNFLGLSIGYSHVRDAATIGGTEAEGLFVPSIGFNYFRKASESAKFGIMTDIELSDYLIFDSDLERENVFIVVAVASFQFQDHLTLLGGFGREFDNNEQVQIIRMGAEFPFELKKGWEVIPEFLFDIKNGTYNVYTLGVSFGLNI